MPDTDTHARTAVGLQIKEARLQRRWSQAMLADKLGRATGYRCTTTAKYVSKWERGDRNPGFVWAPVIEDVLDLDLTASDAAAPDERDPAVDDGSSISLEAVELIQPPVATLVDGGSEDDPMRRRTVLGSALGLVGSAALGSASDMLEPVRQQLDAALTGPVTEQDAVEWERAADHHSVRVGSLPAEQVLPELLIDLADLRRQIHEVSDRLRPRMLRACALMSGLAATSLVGAGYWPQGERYWRIAERAARHNGDGVLRCRIASKRAILSLYTPNGNIATVLSMADDALRWGEGTSTPGTASALAVRAQGLSLLGDRKGATSALVELQNTYESLDDRYRNRWDSWGWPEVRLHHVRSFVYSNIGSARDAVEAQDAALKSYAGPLSAGAVQVQMHRARSIIAMGDALQGIRHVVTMLEQVEPSFRHGYIRTSAEFALQALPEKTKTLPEVRHARELMSRHGEVRS